MIQISVFAFIVVQDCYFYAILSDCLSLQLKKVMESDAAMTEDLIAYNIIPLDGPSLTNVISDMPEVSFFPLTLV